MKTRLTRMNICPQFYSLIELLSRLELVTFHFNLFTNCTHYYLQSTCYHPNEDKNHDPTHVRVLISKMSKLKKLEENRLITQDLVAFKQWSLSLWSQNWYIETKYQFGDYVVWFPRAINAHSFKFQRWWFGPHKIK